MNSQIKLTDSAENRLNILLDNEKLGSKLRIKVDGGGCSGFQYIYEFVNNYDDSDLVINDKLVIDNISADLMKGAIIDYVQTLGSAGFEIKNPIADAKCGCGNSFSVNMDKI